ncbi:P-loop NTPase family protein [Bacteroides caecigallinarum]|uniref:hypothetical protein n=1 Tax=Bacteroides caecigallinarum TaxID=1411144 RepID=UPI001F486CD4|nr:hypothetical protein [Bacteroides caecigallinarum]MCF2581988.1 hypothetical protein [Bacteroides caecigallinarum]
MGKFYLKFAHVFFKCSGRKKNDKGVAIDDFGIEGTFYDCGNSHIVFSEIVDGIEIRGTLLIANTNLTLEEIKAKYGLRTFDRLKANMCIVVIWENSLRGKYKKGYVIFY